MPERQHLDAERARLLDEADRLPGVADVMRLYGYALPATKIVADAQAAGMTVATGANGLIAR